MASGRRDWVVALSVMIVAVACGGDGARDQDAGPELREVVSPGRFNDRDLVEASGLARSLKDSNVFWANNDSGNDPILYAFDSTGYAQGRVRIDGARNRDWEAMSRGPCDRGSCLYIGDVGDNGADHETVRVWRIVEPAVNDTVSTSAELLTFRYADGPRDVESIWVAADTAVYLLTKRPDRDANGENRPARIYRLPSSAWRTGDTATAALFDSLPIAPTRKYSRGWITDAALSGPDSSGAARLAVRTYDDVYVFAVDTATWRPAGLLARCSLRKLKERTSGEGVTWLDDGRLMFDAEGSGARLHTGRCP